MMVKTHTQPKAETKKLMILLPMQSTVYAVFYTTVIL